ncbi:MAG: MiaB/RimO family radical SAM methylthiotransferase, partial [Candidatus Geothermincolales bacterium]
MRETTSSRRYHLITYGCQMNRHDAERVAGLLETRGWRPAQEPEGADAVIFITCCVRQSAEDRFYGRLSSLKRIKRPHQVMAVGGCVAQKEGEKLLERFPFVDLVFGTAQYPRIAELLEEAREQKVVALEMDGLRTTILPSSRDKAHRAWITVIEGCDNFCSYCIVPYVRGRERSRPAEEIVREAEASVAQGAREIFLLGQNVNSYMRRETGRSRFAELLYTLAERLPGDVWIRFTTNHPRDLDRETVRALAEIPNLCKHVHLPLQAGSDRILAAMNRGYTSKEYMEKVALLRSEVDGVSITTDLMVGFPGETDEDF